MEKQMIIIILICLIILGLLSLKKRKNYTIENQGERQVSEVLKKIKGYKLLNNILIKNQDKTTQIDHILIGKKGIFVIETKDFSGIITGEEYSKEWVQILNGNANNFYNPIRQNYGHIKSIENLLKMKNICISVIVFTNKSKFKEVDTETPVIQLKELKRFIRKYSSNISINKEEIEEIYNLIKKNNINSNRIRRKHIKNIKKKISIE